MEKNNKSWKNSMISGGLSLALVAAGFGLGKLESKDHSLELPYNAIVSDDLVDQCLKDYIQKRSVLENDIASLLEQKEKLQNSKSFNLRDLLVIENKNVNNETNLYILYTVGNSGLCYEYHNEFQAWYQMHSESETHNNSCLNFIHFDEYQPLLNYLTDEEIKKIADNYGRITTLEMDIILERIRKEYQKQKLENNSKELKIL